MKLFKIGLLFGVVLIACLSQSQAQNITEVGNAQGTNNSQPIEGNEVRVNVTDVQRILESIINSLPIGGSDIAPPINNTSATTDGTEANVTDNATAITEANSIQASNSSLPIEITEAKADIVNTNEEQIHRNDSILLIAFFWLLGFIVFVLIVIGCFYGISWLLRYKRSQSYTLP
jgi:hypothetical protein